MEKETVYTPGQLVKVLVPGKTSKSQPTEHEATVIRVAKVSAVVQLADGTKKTLPIVNILGTVTIPPALIEAAKADLSRATEVLDEKVLEAVEAHLALPAVMDAADAAAAAATEQLHKLKPSLRKGDKKALKGWNDLVKMTTAKPVDEMTGEESRTYEAGTISGKLEDALKKHDAVKAAVINDMMNDEDFCQTNEYQKSFAEPNVQRIKEAAHALHAKATTVRNHAHEPAPRRKLTPAEREQRNINIVKLISEGASNKEISHQLDVDPATVSDFRRGFLKLKS